MKNFTKYIYAVLLMGTTLLELSCDQFDNIFLNLPLKQEITASGNGPTISEIAFICLSDYDTYNDNIDNVEAIKYVNAAFLTITSTQGLQGSNIVASVFEDNGFNPIFSVTLPTAVADDYVNKPFEIALSAQEIDLLNMYLADYENHDCFMAQLTVSNVSGTVGPPYSITGKIELVVELKVKI